MTCCYLPGMCAYTSRFIYSQEPSEVSTITAFEPHFTNKEKFDESPKPLTTKGDRRVGTPSWVSTLHAV